MKVTIILGGLILAVVALAGEPAALAAGLAATQHVTNNQEPALMVLSGASLLAAGNLLRRCTP
jgi:hypothetical protein